MKRAIRKRVWSGDGAKARDVGENLRDVQSAISGLVSLKLIALNEFVYHTIDIELDSKPQAILVVHVENLDGSTELADPIADWRWDGRIASMTVGSLPTGRKYATIKLLVIS